jgi:predicted ATPase
LNGPYGLGLGEFVDVLRHSEDVRADSRIVIGLSIDGHLCGLALTSENETARYANFKFLGDFPGTLNPAGLGTFCYLSAEREGPRTSASIQSAPREQMEIGAHGQYVANVLSVCERDAVIPSLEHPSAKGQRLLKHVEAWLGTLVPGVEIRTETAPDLDLVAVKFKRGGVSAEWERPANTGFGVSYSLPIVAAALIAKPGSTLIIDSPEAHLHPSAQSGMGSFLGRVAAAGVQVFIETHSDHILNGVRLATVDEQHPLEREDVIINHLRLVDGRLNKEEVIIDQKGGLSSRPPEFFDQAEHDLAAIVSKRFPAG